MGGLQELGRRGRVPNPGTEIPGKSGAQENILSCKLDYLNYFQREIHRLIQGLSDRRLLCSRPATVKAALRGGAHCPGQNGSGCSNVVEQLGGKPGDRKFRANRFAESPASNTLPLEVLLLGGGWRNCLGCLRLTAEQCLGDGQTSSLCSLKTCAFGRAAGPAPPPAVVGHLRAHRPRPCWQLCGFPDFRCLHAMGNGRGGRGGHRGRRAPASCRLPRPRPQLPVGSGPGVTSAPAWPLPTQVPPSGGGGRINVGSQHRHQVPPCVLGGLSRAWQPCFKFFHPHFLNSWERTSLSTLLPKPESGLPAHAILPGPASISSCWAIAETPGLALGLVLPWMTLYAQAQGPMAPG